MNQLLAALILPQGTYFFGVLFSASTSARDSSNFLCSAHFCVSLSDLFVFLFCILHRATLVTRASKTKNSRSARNAETKQLIRHKKNSLGVIGDEKLYPPDQGKRCESGSLLLLEILHFLSTYKFQHGSKMFTFISVFVYELWRLKEFELIRALTVKSDVWKHFCSIPNNDCQAVVPHANISWRAAKFPALLAYLLATPWIKQTACDHSIFHRRRTILANCIPNLKVLLSSHLLLQLCSHGNRHDGDSK